MPEAGQFHHSSYSPPNTTLPIGTKNATFQAPGALQRLITAGLLIRLAWIGSSISTIIRKHRTKGTYRLLILDGHESHHSTEFELFCKTENIATLYMPPHSSHFLQPLDVGCFGPLKQAYGRQIEWFMRAHINHISKLEFLCAFREAFFIRLRKKLSEVAL